MTLKSVGLMGFGVAAGVVFTMLALHHSYPNEVEADLPLQEIPMQVAPLAAVGKSESRVMIDRAAAEVDESSKNPTPQLRSSRLPFPFPANSEEIQINMKELERAALLRAGFTEGRIEWIARRSAELQAGRQKELAERLPGQPQDFDLKMARLDRDLDLSREISSDEFDRYRRALGRATSVPVAGVAAGGNAERAGLLAGDEVISYAGKRVYSLDQLDGLASMEGPGVSVSIEIRRGGQPMQLWMQSGLLGIQGESLGEQGLRMISALLEPKPTTSYRAEP